MGVIGDDAEASVGRILFHDPPQRHLGCGGHCIGFVKDDELEGADGRCIGSRGCGENLFCT